MDNQFDDFFADIDKMIKNKGKLSLFSDEQKQAVIIARERGLIYTELVSLCEKHFNIKVSVAIITKLLKEAAINETDKSS